MLAYLHKTGNQKYAPNVWWGVGLAGIASILSAILFHLASISFAAHEELFEGVTLLLAALMVSWLILWMFRQKKISQQIEAGLKKNLEIGHATGVAFFSFIVVFREGIEIVLFLGGINLATGSISAFAATLGAAAAFALAYLVFKSIIHLNLSQFFKVTSILLIILAAGLVSQGVHELEEAGVISPVIAHVYDVTPAVNADGSYPLMHEKGIVGGTLKGVMGYDTNPSLMQVLAYFAYLAMVFIAYQYMMKQR